MWTGYNLHIMCGLTSGSVDLVYFDPPFNCNADYTAPIESPTEGAEFKDTWNLIDIDVVWLESIRWHSEPLLHMLKRGQQASTATHSSRKNSDGICRNIWEVYAIPEKGLPT